MKAMTPSKSPVVDVLQKLHVMRPTTAQHTKSNVERAGEKLKIWILFFGGVAFLILMAFAGLKWVGVQLSQGANYTALTFGIIAIVLPMVSMLVGIFVDFWGVIRFQKDSLRIFLTEIERDNIHVAALTNFRKKELEKAKYLIQLKSTRIRNRLGLFVGGPEKIALFSLATLGLATYKDLSSVSATVAGNGIVVWGVALHDVLWYVAAFLTGIALAAVLMNKLLQHYIYQMELLDMAISEKEDVRVT